MGVTHEPWLVALSLLVAIQGAYVGLTIALSIAANSGFRRRIRLAGASLALGVSIWAMHFIGILAARLPKTVDYLVLPTLISFLVCVIVVSVALLVASTDLPRRWKISAAAVFMGSGIVSMHYVGMMALHTSMHMHHNPVFVVLSVMTSICASALALQNCFGAKPPNSPMRAAFILGLAISGMHYIAMTGLTIMPIDSSNMTLSPALSSDLLAIVVAMVAFFVSGLFMLTLLPEKPAATVASGMQTETRLPSEIVPLQNNQRPERRYAEKLPVQRSGLTHMMAVEHIFAVQANGHYTLLFDGKDDHFCSLSISEVTERLNPELFLRVHRSHLVNLAHLASLRRGAEGAVVEMQGPARRHIPVSRAQVAALKSHFEARAAQ